MTQTTLSTKYQLVIPKEIRQKLHLHSGQKMMVFLKGNVISLTPERSLRELRGIAKSAKPGPWREKKDRF